MKRLILSVIISAIAVILTSDVVWAIKTVSVYPDYTINVKLDVYEKSAYMYYAVTISLRNNITKEQVKAWNIYDSVTDTKINGSGSLKSFVKNFEKDTEEKSYTQAFNFAVESAFHIALIIQDAGLIPKIDFKEFDLTHSDGRMTFFNTFVNVQPNGIPTGEWRNIR